MVGGVGDDSLDGGSEVDTLVGGSDADDLQGGLGDDILFGDALDTPTAQMGEDTLEEETCQKKKRCQEQFSDGLREVA